MLQSDLESPQLLRTAVARANAFINSSGRIPHKVRTILISSRHVAFVELSQHTTTCSEALPLLTDSSATQCSPGFRVLAQVLSSDCWKTTWAHREKWPFSMPPEVSSEILHSSEPRDAVSFAQVSFENERWYYASAPQFRDVSVRSLGLSMPCCGDRTGLEDSGVHCSKCFVWQHQKCIRLETFPSDNSSVPFVSRRTRKRHASQPVGLTDSMAGLKEECALSKSMDPSRAFECGSPSLRTFDQSYGLLGI
ncbi:hypothetical protein NUU61_009809 [Penicillium alfredii]|uniref:Uncharacterized protein n=1 Tax=Penicillium alfredii TaxID=1506179 RepID=A0A9W9EGZ6_9EURO|nr:uncharacterized protein NUU61_009809 [Penicillium alfredii]KAJ5081545.1 hypothetical protein NUU61_009809 [Penicillium alfredii]